MKKILYLMFIVTLCFPAGITAQFRVVKINSRTVSLESGITYCFTSNAEEKLSVVQNNSMLYSFSLPVEITPVEERDLDGKFTLAMIPDTQTETFSGHTMFSQRTQWLVKQKEILDIRGVLHVGDVVNWDGTPVLSKPFVWEENENLQCQYVAARAFLKILRDAQIPTSLSIGNHDAMVTGGGKYCGCSEEKQPNGAGGNCGSARNSNDLRDYGTTSGYEGQELLRMTNSFNYYLDNAKDIPTWTPWVGEPDRVDNGYWTFEAAGAKFLVLNLELWPRTAVTVWAKEVIRTNQDKNVIIQTHNMFDGSSGCNISGAGRDQENWEYGHNSPQRVWNQLVEPFPNVKVVTCGHVGDRASAMGVTQKGHKVLKTLQNDQDKTVLPITRLMEFDVKNNKIKTWIYSNKTNQNYNEITYDIPLIKDTYVPEPEPELEPVFNLPLTIDSIYSGVVGAELSNSNTQFKGTIASYGQNIFHLLAPAGVEVPSDATLLKFEYKVDRYIDRNWFQVYLFHAANPDSKYNLPISEVISLKNQIPFQKSTEWTTFEMDLANAVNAAPTKGYEYPLVFAVRINSYGEPTPHILWEIRNIRLEKTP